MVLYLLNTPTRPPPFQDLEGKNDLLRPCAVGNSFVISVFTLKILFKVWRYNVGLTFRGRFPGNVASIFVKRFSACSSCFRPNSCSWYLLREIKAFEMVSGVELEVSPDFLMFVEMNRFYVTSAGFHMLYIWNSLLNCLFEKLHTFCRSTIEHDFQTNSSNFLTVILHYLYM